MFLYKHISPIALGLLPACLAWGLSMPPTQADVAIVAQQTVDTGPSAAVPTTVHLFFQGSNARLEVTGGPTVLYDGKDGFIQTLDTKHHEYYTTLYTQAQQEGDPSQLNASGSIAEHESLNLRKTNQTEIIDGLSTHEYTLTGSVTYSRNAGSDQGGRGQGGHRRGGGGFGSGGGFGGGGRLGGGMGMLGSGTIDQYAGNDASDYGGGYGGHGREGGPIDLPSWNISGDVWLADSVKYPNKATLLPIAQYVASSAGPFLKSLADALGKQKGVLLLAKISVTETPSITGQTLDQFGAIVDSDSSASGAAPTTTATTFAVQAVTTPTLDVKLFQAPLAFALVPAPPDAFVPGGPLPQSMP